MNTSQVRSWLIVTIAVARRPDLWSTAGRALRSHAPNRWWRTKPWLPLPDRRWMEFRMATAYGSASPTTETETLLQPDEVVEWLEWLRSWNRDSE